MTNNSNIKNIVFGGNINIHIYPLALALSSFKNIFIIIDSNSLTNRIERRQEYKNLRNLTIIDFSKDGNLNSIINEFNVRETIHINTSLKKQNNYTSKALKLLLKKKCIVFSLPQEGFQFQGWKGSLNRLKWYIYINFYYKNIKGYGLTGSNAFNDFKSIGCNKSKCFPCLYATTPPTLTQPPINNKTFTIIFVGAIDKRKNIKTIIKWLIHNKEKIKTEYKFHIFGGYGDVQDLNNLIKNNPNFFYHGIVPNKQIQEAMCQSDLLILPSLYDGWGAVINEALQCGCKVLVSNRCGSECLVRNRELLGNIFDVLDEDDFINKFIHLLQKGKLTNKNRKEIIEWSHSHISPEVIANYLNQIFEYYCNNKKTLLPIAPWI